jgi:hypothetical protein
VVLGVGASLLSRAADLAEQPYRDNWRRPHGKIALRLPIGNSVLPEMVARRFHI